MDYAELLAEVSERSGIPGLPMRAEAITRMAEAELNKRLVVGAQEVTATLTTGADKTATIPGDYVVMRRVSYDSREVQQWPLGDIESGKRQGYAIQGGRIVTSWADREITVRYYAGLLPLSLESGDWLADDWAAEDWALDASTNWLLEDEPELYVYALLKQWFAFNATRAKGAEAAEFRQQAMDAGQYMLMLVDNRNGLDLRARFGGMRFRTGGVTP